MIQFRRNSFRHIPGSTETNENAALVSNGAEVTFNNDAISRTSSDSQGGDNSSFYGVGAAVLATDGTAYVKDSTITTDSKGGAGLLHTVMERYMRQIQISAHSRILQAVFMQLAAENSMHGISA